MLKILWDEAESPAVREAIAIEDQIIVSSLAELEVEVQLRARWLRGDISPARYKNYRTTLASLREMAPFAFRELPGTVFHLAIRQLLSSDRTHCRSLDRLHLAARKELGLRRLMTHDAKQAAAARALGWEVLQPRSV